MPNRTQFQQLADVRVAEAEALIAKGLWAGAYYLAGYAVELGLKACILARVERTGIIFKEKRFSEDCWTHDIEKLLGLADLKTARDTDAPAGSQRAQHWATAKDWNEASRYELTSQAKAEALLKAITDQTDGVLTWIRQLW